MARTDPQATPPRANRRSRRVAILLTSAALTFVILGGLSLLYHAVVPAFGPPPTHSAESSGPSDQPTAPPDVDKTDQARGDGTYLDGNAYLRGINMYTLEIQRNSTDLGQMGEPQATYDYLASRGHAIIRLAVPWQQLQPVVGGDVQASLDAPLNARYVDVVRAEVAKIAHAGMRTVLDLHNGCTYPWGPGDYVPGSVACGDGITEAQASGVWIALSNIFKDDDTVAAYDIFNEPRMSVGIDTYKTFSQAVVTALRNNGDTHTLWVEGILSTSDAGRLATIAPEGPWVVDPLKKIVYSEHFYATANSSATYSVGADYQTVLTRLTTFAQWCQKGGVHCAVGEVGWPAGGEPGQQSANSAAGWNELFDSFYTLADSYKLDVTYFAATSIPDPGGYIAYGSDPATEEVLGIQYAYSQATIIEKHPTARK